MINSSGHPKLTSRPALLAVAAVLLVAGLLAYANSFSVPFLLDDVATLQGNAALRKVWPLWEAFSPPTNTGVGGRPVANLAFILNYAATGESLAGFHAVNLLIHLLAALILFGLVRRTLQFQSFNGRFSHEGDLLAVVAAALWWLHPIQTQSVTYLSQRTELLLGLFYFLCLYAFIRAHTSQRPRVWLSVAVLSCLAGVASKESMVTAPVLLLSFDYLFVAGRDWGVIRARRLGFYAALAISWLLLALLMRDLPARGVGFGSTMDSATYALIESTAVLRYALLSLWPRPLIFDYGVDFNATTPAAYATAAVALLALGLVAWLFLRGRRSVFPALWFLVVLAPTSSVVPIPLSPVSENRVYLPLAAISVGVILVAYHAAGRRGLIACLALAPAFAALTWQRNLDYRSAISIWADTAHKLPHSSRAHNNLGKSYHEAGRLPEAMACFTKAIDLRPDYAVAHENLATVAGLIGRDDLAVKHGRLAIRLDPRRIQAHYNLGVALRNTGDLAGAEAAFEAAARVNPSFAVAIANAADIQLQRGEAATALATCARALALDPQLATARNVEAASLHQLGRTTEAIQRLRANVQDHPEDATAHFLLGSCLLNTGAPAEAIPQLEQVLRLNPRHTLARTNLAACFVQLGRGAEATPHAIAGLQSNPSDPFAHCILGLALAQSGRLAEARAALENALRLAPDFAPARENLDRIKAQQTGK